MDQVPLPPPPNISEELAEELRAERERSVDEIGAAIERQRGRSNSVSGEPVDFTRLARSKAARLSVSLPDSMPLVTPIVGVIENGPIKEEADGGTEDDVDVETVVEESEGEKESPEKSGYLTLSDDEDDHDSDDEDDDAVVDVESVEKEPTPEPEPDPEPKPRKRGTKKPLPTPIQM
jgi:hypothetical protein